MKQIILLLVLCFGVKQVLGTGPDINIDVEKYELKNGMKVLLHVDRKVPMVALHQWYDVGSFHEDRDRTGLAHFFEHLMFEGTSKYPTGEFSKIVSQVGGQNNAFTNRDYTGYYEMVPSSALKKALELEADRMTNLVVTLPQIKKEREVVKEERRMRTENSPDGYVFEVMMRKVFGNHPYGDPVIGSMAHLNKTSLPDFMAFYKKFYTPNNSTLVVSGDFDSNKVKSWINKYYSKIPRAKIPQIRVPKLEPIANGTVTRDKKSFNSRKLAIYFMGPALGAKDGFVLDIIAEILAGDDSSPITKYMVDEKKMATSVSLWNYSLKHAGVIMFDADLVKKTSFNLAAQTFFNKVQRLVKSGVSDEQLQKAKDKISLSYVKPLKTISGKARLLAQNEIIRGNYKDFFDDIAEYQSIKKSDISKVAKKYLNRSQAHILYLGK